MVPKLRAGRKRDSRPIAILTGTISALYTYPKSVTLYGNGGKYGEADVVTVDYPDKGSLNLASMKKP